MIYINNELFSDHTTMLLDILEKNNIDLKEKEYRKKELLDIYNHMKDTQIIDNKYYNISHEIRSLE